MQHDKEAKREQLHGCIRAVREGDQAAFAALLSDYEPLVGAEVSRYAAELGAQDVEDLRQTALIALYRAALNFDLSQCEVEFGLYAKICIHNALASFVEAWIRNSNELSVPDEWLGEGDHGEGDPARRLMEEEAVQLLLARIRKVLSPFENRVWNLYMAGFSAKEIGRVLGKEPHSIENAVYRIRQKLRAELKPGG
jgi:RNA polymerase sporulation-specific sigma factor